MSSRFSYALRHVAEDRVPFQAGLEHVRFIDRLSNTFEDRYLLNPPHIGEVAAVSQKIGGPVTRVSHDYAGTTPYDTAVWVNAVSPTSSASALTTGQKAAIVVGVGFVAFGAGLALFWKRQPTASPAALPAAAPARPATLPVPSRPARPVPPASTPAVPAAPVRSSAPPVTSSPPASGAGLATNAPGALPLSLDLGGLNPTAGLPGGFKPPPGASATRGLETLGGQGGGTGPTPPATPSAGPQAVEIPGAPAFDATKEAAFAAARNADAPGTVVGTSAETGAPWVSQGGGTYTATSETPAPAPDITSMLTGLFS